jgi:hypothetical protein
MKPNMLSLHTLLRLEDTNIVSNALFLVLRDALCYPCDVADFLKHVLAENYFVMNKERTCSRSLTHAYTMP